MDLVPQKLLPICGSNDVLIPSNVKSAQKLVIFLTYALSPFDSTVNQIILQKIS